jgi:Cfr10I/Bse634I restriction endonuclease
LNGVLPAPDAAFTDLFEAWTVQLATLGASQNAVNNVKGDWYEWLLAICMWNHRVNQNPAVHIGLKLPNVTQFEVSRLYEPQLHAFITDLRQKVEENAHVSLITSNPDFVFIRHAVDGVPQALLNPIAQVDDAALTLLDTAYEQFVGHCAFEQIAGYASVKASLRPDRRLQMPHEGSLMKALYMHLQTRQWVLRPKGIRYYAIAPTVSNADREALRTVATPSIVSVQIRPERAVDAVHTVNSFNEGRDVMTQILAD